MNFYYTIHGIQINNIKSSIAVRVIFLTRELVCSKCTRNMRGSGGGGASPWKIKIYWIHIVKFPQIRLPRKTKLSPRPHLPGKIFWIRAWERSKLSLTLPQPYLFIRYNHLPDATHRQKELICGYMYTLMYLL